MKYLFITVKSDRGNEQSYVLEGDRRQSNHRMIQRALETLSDEELETIEENKEYKTRETKNNYKILESRLLKDDEELKQLKRENMTLVINENVTENACQVRYSGSSRR